MCSEAGAGGGRDDPDTEPLWMKVNATRIMVHLRSTRPVFTMDWGGLNILYQRKLSRPTDWQSATVAASEVGFASLTHSWNNRIVESCTREYKRSRWPHGIPRTFLNFRGCSCLHESSMARRPAINVVFRRTAQEIVWLEEDLPHNAGYAKAALSGRRLSLVE
jgi:hypothetical protein